MFQKVFGRVYKDIDEPFLSNPYKKYKESRNNIPDLPYIPQRHKNLLDELAHTFHLPPKDNKIGFDSPYYKYKLYKNGGISYKEIMKKLKKSF